MQHLSLFTHQLVMLGDIKFMQRHRKCEVGEQAFNKVSWQIYDQTKKKKNGSENYYNILKRLS